MNTPRKKITSLWNLAIRGTTSHHVNHNAMPLPFCYGKNELQENLKTKKDLMSDQFPFIWIELKVPNGQATIMAGFLREWTREKEHSE